ncbi:hypothetical protein ACRALDRAFT_209472 [Sodiomyces alcalophilus JCM 7366]|uniref:uncharacterized protein n=1 Tax=Sodiomyces alcalophilus JCM 7366 TaxID=591952 RepID=UPI0039B378EC
MSVCDMDLNNPGSDSCSGPPLDLAAVNSLLSSCQQEEEGFVPSTGSGLDGWEPDPSRIPEPVFVDRLGGQYPRREPYSSWYAHSVSPVSLSASLSFTRLTLLQSTGRLPESRPWAQQFLRCTAPNFTTHTTTPSSSGSGLARLGKMVNGRKKS